MMTKSFCNKVAQRWSKGGARHYSQVRHSAPLRHLRHPPIGGAGGGGANGPGQIVGSLWCLMSASAPFQTSRLVSQYGPSPHHTAMVEIGSPGRRRDLVLDAYSPRWMVTTATDLADTVQTRQPALGANAGK